MKINDDDRLIVQHIKDNTPENAVVFLTGIGKYYPIASFFTLFDLTIESKREVLENWKQIRKGFLQQMFI